MDPFGNVNPPEVENDDRIYLVLPGSVTLRPVELQNIGGSCSLPSASHISTDFLPMGEGTTFSGTYHQEIPPQDDFKIPHVSQLQIDKQLSTTSQPPRSKKKRGRRPKVRKSVPQTPPRVKKYDLEPTTERIRNAVTARRNRILAKERVDKMKNDLALKDGIISGQGKTIARLNLQISEYERRFEIIRSVTKHPINAPMDDTNLNVDFITINLENV
ncbi:hypothetical protein Fcan01_26869 [Folsomia candida]|uniref:BZIP domain-containing protein n=2 Tax=Folsomia candida TaxID=158441 RepID=A0A226CZE2_FOLCA|nr:hypothetical protein Fcan01_26869 [Folsomia candida]